MEQLIEALQIFLKYGNPSYPTHCGHDTLYINIDPKLVSPEDTTKLHVLGFKPDGYYKDMFSSFRYGSV